MKKLLATIAILGTLTLLGSPTAQAASAKAGAACSKAGSTQVVAGKKFTCVRSGKKLVWNKGVAVVAKPTPIETAPVISLDKLDASWTSKVALAKVNEKLSTMPQSSLQPEIIASPTTKQAEKELELKLLQPVMRLFQQYFSPAKFQVVMFTNEDADWARNALKTYGGNFPGDIGDEIAKQSANPRRCNFAFATRTASGTPIYYECTDTRQIRDDYNYQNPPHEYFHLVHQYLAPVQLPVWLFEGSASFFGEMIGYSNFSNPVPRKLQQGFNTGHDFDPDNAGFDPNRFEKWLATATSADVTKVFKVLETEPARARRYYAEYALGSWATEALVAVYGVDGFMKIWQNAGNGQSFETAFKSAFGLTPDEFYVKLTPYLNSRKNPKIN